MSISRQAAISLTNLRLRVRRIIGDVDLSTDNQRFSDTDDIDPAINDMLVEMQNKLTGSQVDNALVLETLTYGAGLASVALPSTVNYETIYRVEDYTDSTRPREIQYVPPEEIERWPQDSVSDLPSLVGKSAYKYSIVASTTTTISISVRPKPAGAKTLRIGYIASPFIMGADADTLPLSPRWQELVARGAAERLMAVDNEGTEQQAAILARLWASYVAFGQKVRSPQRITRVRRGR